MKKLIPIVLSIILIMSCEKHDNTCNCNDPLEDLAWLKELKSTYTNCACTVAIVQATYKKQTVFYATMNDPLCDGYFPIVLRDCDGNTINVYEPPLGDTFTNEVTHRKVLYNCKTVK